MRIFYATADTPNAAMAVASSLWRKNLYEPLVDLGHDVVEFDYDLTETFRRVDTTSRRQRQFIDTNRPRVSAELLRQVKAAHARQPLELLFTYFYDACVTPDVLEAIRDLGIVTVNWYCNGSYQLHLVSEISPHYDWCLVPEKFRLEDYRAMGARPLYCQEAANPNWYRPHDLPLEFDVAFVGQAYGERPHYVHHLLEAGLDVHVWGPNWERWSDAPPRHTLKQWKRRLLGRQESAGPTFRIPGERIGPPLSDDELIRMYSRARVNLGFSSVGETHKDEERIVQVRLRDFEVPMAGGFYMVEHMDELAEFYEIGKEIVCYDGPEDLAVKARHYLEHPEEREAIRRAGHERCLADHTWHKRFQTAFAQMGLA